MLLLSSWPALAVLVHAMADCTAQVCRGFGEGRPSAADHPYHHMNERKRRKNPVNYADEPVVDGLRLAPKRKKGGAKQGDPASRWSQGPMPAPVLVITKLLTPHAGLHHCIRLSCAPRGAGLMRVICTVIC